MFKDVNSLSNNIFGQVKHVHKSNTSLLLICDLCVMGLSKHISSNEFSQYSINIFTVIILYLVNKLLLIRWMAEEIMPETQKTDHQMSNIIIVLL